MMMNKTMHVIVAAMSVATACCAEPDGAPESGNLAVLREAVTSFGAVTDNGWLYTFGGHKGARHDYCAEMVSGSFYRLNLSEGAVWETLPTATPGQGMPLVAVNGHIWRIGGMAALNPQGQPQDLRSMALVQHFDVREMRWQDLPPLPEPRSSHDAAVVEGRIYAAGGWRLAGAGVKPVWPDTALTFDPAHPENGWREFPQPFRRRALAVAALGTRLYCIGGMNSDNKPTLAVDVYDTSDGRWSKGPDLPDGKNKGFGCSAIAQNGTIYVTASPGDLLRLSPDGQRWETVGKLNHARITHRLVTAGKTQLIALGGENEGVKTQDLERLNPDPENESQKGQARAGASNQSITPTQP